MNEFGMTTRSQLEDQIGEIRRISLRMGECVGEMIRVASDAVCQSNSDLARSVVVMDDTVDRLESECVRLITLSMMRHAPVASDLKFLSAALGVVHEIEQAADDAVKLARRTIKLSGQFPGELKSDLAHLAEKTRVSFSRSLKLFVEYSDDLADEIIASDSEIDAMYKDARNKVVEMLQANPDQTRSYIRVIDAFHSLEHVADHAVEIAKRLKTTFGRDESLTSSKPA